MNRKSLVGIWKLTALHLLRADQVVPFWGDAPPGRLIYTADGHMAAELMATDRRPWASPDVLASTMEERADAMTGYISYAGRWELDGAVVKHHIEVCVVPNWSGTTQTRRVELDGERLTLSTEPVLFDGVVQVVAAHWRRIGTKQDLQ